MAGYKQLFAKISPAANKSLKDKFTLLKLNVRFIV
jgi:hypothetical protein